MSAGATESIVVVPFELVKIRLQDRVRQNFLPEPRNPQLLKLILTHAHYLFSFFLFFSKNSSYKGPLDVVVKTVKAQGVLGLYGGLESTFWR
jgi:solute carrier family 25 2-oxodicarboxylate transporter 21